MGLGIKLRFTVQGDFEVMGAFDIVQSDATEDSYGVGASIYIATSSESSDTASVALFERAREGRVLVAHRAETTPQGKRDHRQYFRPTNYGSGVLAFNRKGERLGYYFAPALDQEFELVHASEFPADDLNRVRFTAEAGNSPSAVKV